jgi:RNA polymerase sigma-70 factor (ECF subfamily)
MASIDEHTIIERVLAGETEAFAPLVERYSRRLFAFTVQIVGSPEDAEEVVQDAFVNAYRHLNRFRGEASFATWLYRIAYRTAVSAVRARRESYATIDEQSLAQVADERADDLLDSDDENRIGDLQDAIARLTPEERALITLFYYDEHSVEAVAAILAISTANVKVRLHRTRKKLYVLMTDKEDNNGTNT